MPRNKKYAYNYLMIGEIYKKVNPVTRKMSKVSFKNSFFSVSRICAFLIVITTDLIATSKVPVSEVL